MGYVFWQAENTSWFEQLQYLRSEICKTHGFIAPSLRDTNKTLHREQGEGRKQTTLSNRFLSGKQEMVFIVAHVDASRIRSVLLSLKMDVELT